MPVNLDEGFADFSLIVQDLSYDEAGRCRIRAEDRQEGVELGIEVVLPAGMRCGLVERGDDVELDPEAVYYNGVEFHGLGAKSDDLLTFMAKAYGHVEATYQMESVVAFTAIVLEGSLATLAEQAMKCKLFYDEKMLAEDNDEDYCELYLNIDLKQRTLELAEKDQDYRANVIRAFRRKSSPSA